MAGSKAGTSQSKELQEYKLDAADSSLMAKCIELAKSQVVPMAYIGKPANVFAAIMYGKELGIPGMTALQNIAVINGKPTLGTDMFLGLAMRHKEWGGYEITESSDKKATVVVYRVNSKTGKTATFSSTFTIDDAIQAGLVKPGGSWDKWRKRMLKHRATAFALRDAFPDVLSGMYQLEEMDPSMGAQEEDAINDAQDAIEFEVIDESAPAASESPKLAPKRGRPSSATPKKATSTSGGTRYKNGRKI